MLDQQRYIQSTQQDSSASQRQQPSPALSAANSCGPTLPLGPQQQTASATPQTPEAAAVNLSVNRGASSEERPATQEVPLGPAPITVCV